jgi:hypothetical protein
LRPGAPWRRGGNEVWRERGLGIWLALLGARLGIQIAQHGHDLIELTELGLQKFVLRPRDRIEIVQILNDGLPDLRQRFGLPDQRQQFLYCGLAPSNKAHHAPPRPPPCSSRVGCIRIECLTARANGHDAPGEKTALDHTERRVEPQVLIRWSDTGQQRAAGHPPPLKEVVDHFRPVGGGWVRVCDGHEEIQPNSSKNLHAYRL